MAIDQSHKYCRCCQRSQMHFRKGTNHILHLLLTVFMCGWWLPVWLLLAVKVGGWQCETCGYRGHPFIRFGIPMVSLCFLAASCTVVWNSIDTVNTTAKPRSRPTALSPRVETPVAVPDTPETPATVNHVTLGNYNEIQMGDSLARVVELLGSGGEEMSRLELPGVPVTFIRMWQAPGFMGGNCNITFQGGVVCMKAQFGLKGPATSRPSAATPTDTPVVEPSVTPDPEPEPEPELIIKVHPPELGIPRWEPTPEPEPEPVPTPEPEPEWRTWTSADDQYTVEAEFISFAMGDVKLRTKNGKTITLKMKKLSWTDQEWIRKRGRR